MTLDKLKIGLFNECFPPIQDGVSQVVENYARLMHEGGHDVTVATAKVPSFDYPNPYKVKNILSIPIPVRRPYRWGIPTWMAPWQPIYGFQSDIIHVHSPFTAARIALKLRKKYGMPVVATFHSKYKDDFRASVPSDTIVNFMVKNIMQVFDAADEVWVGAPGVIDVMREYGYKGKIEVVPHAIDFDLSGTDVQTFKAQAKAQLGVSSDVPCLLFVGQIIHAKNVLYTLEALRLLHQQGIPFKMFYVGKGNAANELQQAIRKYGMQDCVAYVGQLQERAALQKYYAAADVFLFPSLYLYYSMESAVCQVFFRIFFNYFYAGFFSQKLSTVPGVSKFGGLRPVYENTPGISPRGLGVSTLPSVRTHFFLPWHYRQSSVRGQPLPS